MPEPKSRWSCAWRSSAFKINNSGESKMRSVSWNQAPSFPSSYDALCLKQACKQVAKFTSLPRGKVYSLASLLDIGSKIMKSFL